MREVASVDRTTVGERDIQHHFSPHVLHMYFMCVFSFGICVCTVRMCVSLTTDMFVFIDSKRRAVAAYTAVYGWQGSRLGENVCV